jgi:hypothetical protein
MKKLTEYERELICPYCMNPVSYEQLGCCGESRNHFEEAYIINDIAYLPDEIEEG